MPVPSRVILVGESFNFPSRTDRGMWPVVGLRNHPVQNFSHQYLPYVHITLVDVEGNAFLKDYPLALIPSWPLSPSLGVGPMMTLKLARLPICWEASYWSTAANIFGPIDTAIWVDYGKPDYLAR